ncbi:MAG: hypothetical protein QOD06_2707 [Candidatus Binatota bacterium]|nr:hypothetical protein [Candidatus Binatota bacterium]
MSTTVCIAARTSQYPTGGGHLWVYLNWALGLRSLGCRVIWLERMGCDEDAPEPARLAVEALHGRLARYGLGDALALASWTGERLPAAVSGPCLDLDAATEADLLLDMEYETPSDVIRRFRRSAHVDTDPGLLQFWMARGAIRLAPHDLYFTTGETVGRPEARFPDGGVFWHYAPPCIALDWWPPHAAPSDAPFTTVSHWYMDQWVVENDDSYYANDKRDGFLPFLDLPRRTSMPLELALNLGGDPVEKAALEARGWRIRESRDVAGTPWDYQRYVHESRGEFSCVKPHCIRLQNAWISDRTLCYLASAKPAVVQNTGPSRFLPDAAGLFRFSTIEEAARSLETVCRDYEAQCRLARTLAEEHFDARKVTAAVLERALA